MTDRAVEKKKRKEKKNSLQGENYIKARIISRLRQKFILDIVGNANILGKTPLHFKNIQAIRSQAVKIHE